MPFKEACGICGVYNSERTSELIYTMLFALQPIALNALEVQNECAKESL